MRSPQTVITIGTFDGVHLGHTALVRRAVALSEGAGQGGARARVVVLCFDPHPMTKVRPEAAPARLTTLETRKRELLRLGADEVVRLEPTEELLGLAPEEFVRRLVDEYRPAWLVEGADFRFGRGRAGDVGTLAELGKNFGFGVEVVPSVEVALDDHTLVRASSTIVRWLVVQGRVKDAALVVGRPYELSGVVVRGDRRGRTIGYPTANLATECLLPADGVYAGVGVLADGRRFGAAVSVGTRPTFEGVGRRAEAFFLDAPAGGDADVIEGLPEYGWAMGLEFLAWLREDLRFDSVEGLVAQIDRDCARARAVLGLGEARLAAQSGVRAAGKGVAQGKGAR